MAPSVSELAQPAPVDSIKESKLALKNAANLNVSSLPYPDIYLPHEDTVTKDEPLTFFEHVDVGHRADPAKPNLLNPNTTVRHLSPYLGTELSGVQLSQLSNAGLDEVALFVAERKVVVFRNQDLKDLSPEKQVQFSSYFGRSHVHPISVNVKDEPALAVIYHDKENQGFLRAFVAPKINHTNWHSDVSYERQPPGTTAFYVLDGPDVGGDTLFSSQVEAYNRLSNEFKKRLIGLRAVHTAFPQAEGAIKRGAHIRRDPVETEHPLVRVHPVTREKALYINPGFTTKIVGFKQEESDALLGFLFDHIQKGADFHVRASYEPGTVVIWDNRVTIHSAIVDFDPSIRRHHIRLTPQAEVPIAATEI